MVPWNEETLIPTDTPSSLVPVELHGAAGGKRWAPVKVGRRQGAMLICTLLPARKGGWRGEIMLRFLGFGVGTACELRR